MADNKKSDFLKGLGSSLAEGLGSSLGGLPGSIIGGAIGSLFQGDQMKKQVEHQKELMRYQSDLQKNMQQFTWNNQYGAQVQGMRGAGLNPALMQGGSFGLNSAPSVSGGSASALPVSLPNIAELSLLASQKANVDADTRLKETEADKNAKDSEYRQWEIQVFEQTFNDRLNEIHSRNYKNMSEGRKDEKMIELYDQTITNLKEEFKLINQQVIREGKINNNFDEYFKAKTNVLISEYRLNKSQEDSYRKLTRAYETYYQALTNYTIARKNQVHMDTALDENYKTALAQLLREQQNFIDSQSEFMPMNEIGGLLTKTATAAGVAAGGIGTLKAAQKYGGSALSGAAKSSTVVKGLQ